MEDRTWSFIDKSTWPARGPWNDEPDKVQWTDKQTGLLCLAVRTPRMGNWCGYVGVTREHPDFGKEYDDVDVDVHGGLTYAAACQGDNKEHGICHVVGPGEDDAVWWFGFDTAHCGDYWSPAYRGQVPAARDTYRTLPYVRGEVTELARQLKDRAG